MEDHVADAIEQLDAKKAQFLELSVKHGGLMQFVANFKANYPGLHLKREIIESLAEYGVSLDFDFYYLYSDRREDS